jgi:hypothetical protein
MKQKKQRKKEQEKEDYYITLRFILDIPLPLFTSSKEVLKLSNVVEESKVI